jgi:hypothetical protein
VLKGKLLAIFLIGTNENVNCVILTVINVVGVAKSNALGALRSIIRDIFIKESAYWNVLVSFLHK